MLCSNEHFGIDPYPGHDKKCQCLAVGGAVDVDVPPTMATIAPTMVTEIPEECGDQSTLKDMNQAIVQITSACRGTDPVGDNIKCTEGCRNALLSYDDSPMCAMAAVQQLDNEKQTKFWKTRAAAYDACFYPECQQAEVMRNATKAITR